MRIGAHLRSEGDPIGLASELGAEVIQLFVTDPQDIKAPAPHPQAAQLRGSDIDVVVHSSYRINVASLNNRLRIPSRKAVVQQAEVAGTLGALGLVVHGGHLRDGEDPAKGYENWRKLFERQAADGGFAVPILIENTAGGDNAMFRSLDDIARMWDAVGDFAATGQAGFCLDTCHAWAGGLALSEVVEKVRAITGRIDLVHLNNSRDEFDSGRDRHANLTSGQIDAAELIAVARAADAPVVLETPADGVADDLEYLRERVE